MFKNIGRKVKGLGVAVCIVGMISSVGSAVFLYFTHILDWPICVTILVGGLLTSWLSSWIIYCIGDTNVKMEKMMDKLIPKPRYTEYLNNRAGTRGACELCGRTSDLINARIEDQMGTRYRKVCPECFGKYNCTEAE
jgi:hypothetical protein